MKAQEGKLFDKKIIRGLVRIKYGIDKKLYLGNLMQKRLGSCERLC